MNKISKYNIPLSTRKISAPSSQTPEFKKKLKCFEFDIPGNYEETLNEEVVNDKENEDQKDDETGVEKLKETGLDLEKTTVFPMTQCRKFLMDK